MTLQSSGPIAKSDINVELGNSSTSLLRIGSAEARALAGVPSGLIRISDFYGATNLTLGFDAAFNVRDRSSSPNTNRAEIQFNSNGTCETDGNSVLSEATRWIDPTTGFTDGADYEIRILGTIISPPEAAVERIDFEGVAYTGITGTTFTTPWYALSTNRLLFVRSTTDDPAGERASMDGTIEIREIANPSNITTGTITNLQANSDL